MRITIAVLLCALVVGATTTSASATPRGSDPCDLMEAGFSFLERHAWYANLSEQHGRGSYSCQWTSAGKLNEHGLSLYVFVTRSAREAASEFRQYAPATFGPQIRLPGADEARGKELKPTRRTTSSRVAWRQGRYVCLLSVAGVGDTGDLEEALDLAKPFVRRLARQGVSP